MENNGISNIKDKYIESAKKLMNMHDNTVVLVLSLMMWIIIISWTISWVISWVILGWHYWTPYIWQIDR